MRTIGNSDGPDVLQKRDQVRDQAMGFRASAWQDYVSILDNKERPVLKAALMLTRGSKTAFDDLAAIMQGDLSASDTLKGLEAWGNSHSKVVDAFATSGDALGNWVRLTQMTLPRLVKLEAEYGRADAALLAALKGGAQGADS